MSTPVSELIGAAWTTEYEDVPGSALFFDSHSLDDDEWKSRDRALLFLWQHRDHFVRARPACVRAAERRGRRSTSSVRRTATSTRTAIWPRSKRLVAGIGAEVNLVYPFEAHSYETTRLADAGATIVMYKEYGSSLAREVGLPAFDAPIGLEPTTEFSARPRARARSRGRGRSFHSLGEEHDARGVARYLALDAQRLLRQRADRRSSRRRRTRTGYRIISARNSGCRSRFPPIARAPRARPTRTCARRCGT